MAEVFNDYARYYDLLYKDKDYAGESAYIHALIQEHLPAAKSILNLGCGTGKHDACLEKWGYKISGVDLSETMLHEARKRSIIGKLDFFKDDVRSVDLGKKFDVVVSLFHVISYQTTDADLVAVFRTAKKHLKAGGIFIFDFWHGEGVLKDPPVVRVKRLEDENLRIVRIAEPVMHAERHVIDVNYQVFLLEKKLGQLSELNETHRMRYLFLPEIKDNLSAAGFVIKDEGAWMSKEPINISWYGVVVAQYKDGV